MTKIITILGTRPEIIRLSRIIPKLDKVCNHILIFTGQNYDPKLSDIFFKDLGVRQPDYYLGMKGTLGQQLSILFPKIEEILKKEKPDKVFMLGDTNSSLCAIIVERMGIPLYHMEAGNRSFSKEIPEEIDRRLIDAISSYNLYYTQTAKECLLRDGCNSKKIFMSGNPVFEVLNYYKKRIKESSILKTLNLKSKEYFLVDIHRSELVDYEDRLLEVIEGLNKLGEYYNLPIICSIHPKTKDRLNKHVYKLNPNIKFLEPLGFFEFVKLEQNAKVGLTDSGMCSEEYCLLHVPCVILRSTTERPEVVEAGGATISGFKSDKILESVKRMVEIKNTNWNVPEGYNFKNVSDKVINFMLGEKQ